MYSYLVVPIYNRHPPTPPLPVYIVEAGEGRGVPWRSEGILTAKSSPLALAAALTAPELTAVAWVLIVAGFHARALGPGAYKKRVKEKSLQTGGDRR